MIDRNTIPATDGNKLLFVGMGNRINQDDGAGIYIAEQLMANGIKNVMIAENSIENYIGKINRQKANTIIFIDAVDFGKEPGFYKLLPINEITNTTSNTHNLSLRTISSFLETPDKRVLGIQPDNVSFGTELSQKTKDTCNQIVKEILIHWPEIASYEHRC
jgi:hydrogenase maturation protease